MANLLVAYRYSEYTTANYLVKALDRLGHNTICIGPGHLMDLATLWADYWRTDALIWIEAGGGLPEWLEPIMVEGKVKAAWFIDSHSQHEWHRIAAHDFDHLFVAQRAYVDQFDRPVTWLPVACDPEIHTPPEGIEPEHDVVFCGHTYPGSPLYERRRRLLDMLGERYDLGVYEGAYLRDMAIAHAKGRVVFNVSTCGDLNMRVFEGLCSGRPLVTDWVPGAGLDTLFEPYKHLMLYEDAEQLPYTIDALLSDAGMRESIGTVGRAEVLARHTYRHRAQQMLEVMGL